MRSLHFAWTQRTTDGKGSRTLPPFLRRGRPEEEIPPRDVTYDMRLELWIDGEKMRFEYENYQWDSKAQACLPCPYVGTFDGKLHKALYANGGSEKPFPIGHVQAAQRDGDAMYFVLIPLLMTFRAADPKMRGEHDLSQMAPTGRQATIDGHACHELRLQRPATSLIDQLWVDPSRDCVIVRYVKMDGKRLAYQLNVRYSADPSAGWVPSSWDFVNTLSDGKLQVTGQAEVVEHDINPEVSANTFDIVYPRGTSVGDLAAGRSYIIRPDGTERVLRKEELGLTYEEALASDPGESVGGTSFLARWWQRLLAGTAVFLAVLLGIRYRKRLFSQRWIGHPGTG